MWNQAPVTHALHTRAPPWAFTRTRYTVSVHTIHVTSALTRSPHLEGSASSHRPRGATRGQEGDTHTSLARVGCSDPPIHTLATHGAYQRGTAPKPAVVLLTSTSTQYNHRTASLPEDLPQYIHSVQSSQQPLRLRAGGWATNERLLRPHLRNRGAPTPRGAGADRARPPGSPPRSVALHTHGVPIRTRQLERAPTPRAPKPRCMPESPARAEPRSASREDSRPPPQVPRSRAETSVSSLTHCVLDSQQQQPHACWRL